MKADNEVSVLITVIGPRVLATLSDLVSPSQVEDKTDEELLNILKSHYAPKVK